MRTINFAKSKDISLWVAIINSGTENCGKFKVLALPRIVVDNVITYVWDGIFLPRVALNSPNFIYY